MFIVGLDLGQSQDYSALCVIESTHAASQEAPRRPEQRFAARHLQRWPLGTKYPTIVADVRALLTRQPLLGSAVPLVVDQTGVGRAVCDLFSAAGTRPHGVTITAGSEPNLTDAFNLRVPKRELVGTLVACMQSGRLKIAESMALAPILINELANFKLKIDINTGNDSYEAWRESIHDDLVLAVALACWYGTARNPRPHARGAVAGKLRPALAAYRQVVQRDMGYCGPERW